jgi:hypothetical protein
VKIETTYDIGQRFLVPNVTTESLDYSFVKCEKCEGGIFLGPKGQKHTCKVCYSNGSGFPFLPRGHMVERHPIHLTGRNERTVITIKEVEVESLKIYQDGNSYQVSYIYDSDYDGDLSVPEEMMYRTVEDAILSVLSDEQFKHHCGTLSPFGGVVFLTEITLD